MTDLPFADRASGALWGALVGDALGVPVEFMSRERIQQSPVTGMRGYGTHNQPPGTWSDDSSMGLCTVESLFAYGRLDLSDLGERFNRWKMHGHWTPHGRVFDIGIATSQALSRFASGTSPELSGGADEYSNGNGSLMRIMPIALWTRGMQSAEVVDHVKAASVITHRHPRSQMACGLYCFLVHELLNGQEPARALDIARAHLDAHYAEPPFDRERRHFERIQGSLLRSLPEEDIDASGYVMHTLEASVWCLLNSSSFEEAVLKAVNLGGDTDTTGTVTGGLAGAWFGLDAIPSEWKRALARHDDLEALIEQFAESLQQSASSEASL
jgi:ADP-ribosylglycohydrolase